MKIIDTHREAERTRKLWMRGWTVLALSMATLFGAGWYSTAHAAPVDAYPGCRIAWDYTWATPGTPKGFGLRNNATGLALVAPAVREVPCADLKLAAGPQTIGVQARMEDGRVSPWATIEINYITALPPVGAPTNIRLIMEWSVKP